MADKLSKTERDKRLDQLKAAVDEYGEKKKKQLDADVKFMKSVIKSRTGAGLLSNQAVVDSTKFLVDSIKQFLEG